MQSNMSIHVLKYVFTSTCTSFLISKSPFHVSTSILYLPHSPCHTSDEALIWPRSYQSLPHSPCQISNVAFSIPTSLFLLVLSAMIYYRCRIPHFVIPFTPYPFSHAIFSISHSTTPMSLFLLAPSAMPYYRQRISRFRGPFSLGLVSSTLPYVRYRIPDEAFPYPRPYYISSHSPCYISDVAFPVFTMYITITPCPIGLTMLSHITNIPCPIRHCNISDVTFPVQYRPLCKTHTYFIIILF